MNSIKWTKRTSGNLRTTISVKYHVPKEMIEWIMRETNGAVRTESEAVKFVRKHVGTLADGKHTLAANVHGWGDYELLVVETTDREAFEQDHYSVYTGEVVV